MNPSAVDVGMSRSFANIAHELLTTQEVLDSQRTIGITPYNGVLAVLFA